MAGKEEVLGRVKQALAAGGKGIAAEAASGQQDTGIHGSESKPQLVGLPARPGATPGAIPDDASIHLSALFRAEIGRVGAKTAAPTSENEIYDYIDGLLPRNETGPVAVSDKVASVLPGLRAWLAARKVETLPNLAAFAAGLDQPVAQPAEAGSGQMMAEQAMAAGNNAAGIDLMNRYKSALLGAIAGVTTADFAIADTGTLVLISKNRVPDRSAGMPATGSSGTRGSGMANAAEARADGEQHRLISLVPPIHICLLDPSRIAANLTELLTLVHHEYYQGAGPPLAMTFITGPSRTADIELTLTTGVHGPRELHVLLYSGGCLAGTPSGELQ